jgi:Gas vesicle synthesis protein GvpL/GvpF
VLVRPTEAIVINAAHLVERSRLDEYRNQVRAARGEREELHFLTSGEWPPYNFCDLG